MNSDIIDEKVKLLTCVAWQKIERKMALVCQRNKDKIPYTTINGVYDDRSRSDVSPDSPMGINWWTNGFWGGILWLLFLRTGDEWYARTAKVIEQKLDVCFSQFLGLHHDVGFMWLPTSVASYNLTKDPDSYRRALHAATLLAGRFNPNGNFIRAWNENDMGDTRGWAIIDCMMNLPLLYWASRQTCDPRFRNIAEAHAHTVIDSFIRSNGSVKHIVEFDLEAGAAIGEYGGQGYAVGSSWTRGQSWAIYGFMLSFLYTQNELYLGIARKVADYFISRLPNTKIVPVDFDQPSICSFEDSTAAAIASCGLLELSKVLKTEGTVYKQVAVDMLTKLYEEKCNFDESIDGILYECSESYHAAHKQHMHIIYGDYYFLQALLKLADNVKFL